MADAHEDPDATRLRAAHGAFFETVVAIFARHDPLGLESGEDAAAYLPEIESIIERLHDAAAAEDVRQIVHDEFQRRVDEMAGPEMIYEAIAEELWEAWTHRAPRGNTR